MGAFWALSAKMIKSTQRSRLREIRLGIQWWRDTGDFVLVPYSGTGKDIVAMRAPQTTVCAALGVYLRKRQEHRVPHLGLHIICIVCAVFLVPAPGIFPRQDCKAAQTPLPLPLVRAVEDIDQGRMSVLEFVVPQKIGQTGKRAAAMGKQAPCFCDSCQASSFRCGAEDRFARMVMEYVEEGPGTRGG
jgi:hypothetical protein